MSNRPAGRRPGVEAEVLRGPFDPGGQPFVERKNHLHLSLFAWNVRNGLSASKAVLSDPSRHRDVWEWPSSSTLLRETERAGFDSQLQYGMWSGYGGATGWNDAQLDWATAATGSAVITDRLGIYTTVHTGYGFHPLLVGKITSSIDHMSRGRLGVNIVAGSNAADYAQFGLDGPPSQEVRYAIADEFTTALKLLWTSGEPVDFEGEYFQMYGAQVVPRATSKPRPLLITAAGSDIGLDYAARQCDAVFITAKDNHVEGYRARAQKIRAMFDERGRKVRIAVMCYVVMDESDAAAAETVEWMTEEIDHEALRTWLVRAGHVLNSEKAVITEGSFGDGRDERLDEDRYLGIGKDWYESLGMGMGAYQLFGSYDTVADQLVDLYEAGVDQVALCFFDPHKGVQQVRDQILPRLRARGYNQNLV
ncbi:LLM class flavin-dependent oxidoreductase [Pimelobacter simplex]|uniref:LLM class flavin-dependent oxidoreductase n=1 Tax=Nocardioides simplex TaxID=2045 RepID=UPI00215001E2|nr:LLM class flavin-dependent oxidoreductase [Pimelobacter simplex]UUW91424.1 LLM class flavin-dependent oxidoreductase [Pimelobacter simplex]UUW95252.1 LLM class flavin-dependent oxidoreductase [Pimelobacter simplex]